MCNVGVDFGEAYGIPVSLQGVPFYAAVVLKVAYTYKVIIWKSSWKSALVDEVSVFK